MENSVVPINEMEANQPANPESGEGDHNQPEEARTEHVISVKERLGNIDGLRSDASVKAENKGHKPFIGQLPMLLRQKTELKKYFQPRVMSIGPVHHGKNELEEGQQYKYRLTKLFIEESQGFEEILYNNILNEIESFKECYDQQELPKKFSGDDKELAWMLFVDGCAMIQFIRCYVHCWHHFYLMNIGGDQVDLMATDLMLLVNQLPLGVLNLVMGFSKEGGELYQNDHPVGKQSKEFRQSICGFIEIIEMACFKRRGTGVKADSVTDQSFSKANHLLELIWMKFVKKEKDGRPFRNVTSRHFRSVKELQAAGIRLKPNHGSNSLRNISFYRGFSLKIPNLILDEKSKSILFNLIAYEMHPNFTKDLVVTSYIGFLNSLIATEEDVAELHKVEILINHLLNDQEVLEAFRLITSCLKPYPDIFFDTTDELIKYLRHSMRMTTGKWLGEAIQVYFRSPWTTIAFISATFLLILTIIQTIFSVLAYQR